MDQLPLTSEISVFTDFMMSFGIFHDSKECAEYVECHHERFRKTLEKIPRGCSALLEVGAAPFCMTLMMKETLNCDIRAINYGSHGDVLLQSEKFGRRYVIPCEGINVECEPFPYEDGRFDVVMCAEVIEHLTFCPSFMLSEIHRVLKPGGVLILTTPNAMRLICNYHSARELFHGRPFYDPYSGYGPYGRHNREFTPQELRFLVEGCGFAINEMDVCEIPARGESLKGRLYQAVVSLLFGVPRETIKANQPSQIILSARPEKERNVFLPGELYKSTHAMRKAQEEFPKIP